jgi:4a-hydroxytetrahydrobiopterin dehydratase
MNPLEGLTMPYAEPLTEDEITERLTALPGWSRVGDSISKSYRLKYLAGLGLITHVVVIEEAMDHHADIAYRYGSVEFTITTHAADHSLTHKDFDLADEIERVAAGHDAQ